MQRRVFLSGTAGAVVAGIAGCMGLSDTESDPSGSGDDDAGPVDGSEDDSNTFWKSVEELPEPRSVPPESRPIVGFDTAPLTATASRSGFRTNDGFDVAMTFSSGATAISPATLTGVIANTKPYEQTIETRRLELLGDPPRGRTDDRDTAYLVPSEDHPIADQIPPTPQDDEGRWRMGPVLGGWFPETITVPAESGFVAEYYLIGKGAIRPGYYRFSGEHELEIAIWSTDHPGVDGNSVFAGMEVPALPIQRSTGWYHKAVSDASLAIEPSVETIDPPDVIEFTFRNHGSDTVSFNPHYWRVYKLVNNKWIPVAPWGWTTPLSFLPPGGRVTDTLAIFHHDEREWYPQPGITHLGGGTYAYESGLRVDGRTLAALFEVDAPRITVAPEADAVVTSQDDHEEVELPEHDAADRPTTVTVSREGGTSDVDRTIIPEQLARHRFRPLRNALPLFEPGIEDVRVKSDRSYSGALFEYDDDSILTFQYRDQAYRATIEIEG